jgi:hypothetical protein
MRGPYYIAAANTIDASALTLWLAAVFGRKTVEFDGYYRVTFHHWRGKAYLTKFSREAGDHYPRANK